jgi:glycosyltransferase involved in cell wall biosynthesis
VSAGRPLRIAWLGGAPAQSGGAPGVVTELLEGLSDLGHSIDCFLPGEPRGVPEHLRERSNLVFVPGVNAWRWNRWYSRTRLARFTSGLLARALGSLRMRREILRRHAERPYDVVYQGQTIESLGVPARMRGSVPLVLRPDTHQAGELRWTLRERRLALRCQPLHNLLLVASVMAVRSVVQAVRVRHVDLLVCISTVFRDHVAHDYRFPLERTVVIPNPVRLERFETSSREPSSPPLILVPARISARKGLEDVVALARALPAAGVQARIRVIGGPSTWSDYTCLLDDLPAGVAEYGGAVSPPAMPGELARADLVLLASKYEPFGLTIGEALASGVPVVGTSEVGALEFVDHAVAATVAPGDIDGMVPAIEQMLARLRAAPAEMRALAREQAERQFAREVVCARLSAAFEALAGR